MDYLNIKLSVLNVLRECEIHSFPIDCFELLKKYGLKHKSYGSQPVKKKDKCLMVSDDAFTVKKTIFYNDDMPSGRIRFSLMHELGHFILKHIEPRDGRQEIEANYFASHILAPRMAIHYSGCQNLNDVSKMFCMTHEAADYAFQDYRRWHRKAVYKMSNLDKAMYSHFYNADQDKFIYKIEKCIDCGKLIYNSTSKRCVACNKNHEFRLRYFSYQEHDKEFNSAQNNWLYGGL